VITIRTIVRLALACCGLITPLTAAAQNIPPDFTITYVWRSGSVPPPYHYQYQILLSASHGSRLVMVMNYPSIFDDLTKWKEVLYPSPTQLSKLFASIQDNDLSSTPWGVRDERPVQIPSGGSACWITVVENSHGYSVPCNTYEVNPKYADKQAEFIRLIQGFVPDDAWKKLNIEREDYISRASSK